MGVCRFDTIVIVWFGDDLILCYYVSDNKNKNMKKESNTKRIAFTGRGKSGKSSKIANVVLNMAKRQPNKLHLLFGADTTSSEGLKDFFNIKSTRGLSGFLSGDKFKEVVSGVPNSQNVWFVPSGSLLGKENGGLFKGLGLEASYRLLEEKMRPIEQKGDFSFIGFDLSPDLSTKVAITILYYVDGVVMTAVTDRQGLKCFKDHIGSLMAFNQIRVSKGKEPLKLKAVVPHRYHRGYPIHREYFNKIKALTCAYFGVSTSVEELEANDLPRRHTGYKPLREEVESIIDTYFTPNMGQCGAIDAASSQSLSLEEYLVGQRKDSSSRKAMRVHDSIIYNINKL